MSLPAGVVMPARESHLTNPQRFVVVACVATVAVAAVLGLLASDSWLLALPVIGNAILILIGVHLGGTKTNDGPAVGALDVFLGVAYLHGCVVPLIDMVAGPPELIYRGHSSLQAALLASGSSLAFTLSILFGWTLYRHIPVRRTTRSNRYPETFAWILIALGAVGLAIKAPQAVAGIRGTLVSTSGATSGAGGTLAVIGTFATPLLPVGTFLLLAALAKRRRRRLMLACVLIPLSVLALFSYSLNRAAIILPVVAMILTWVSLNKSGGVGRKLLALALACAALFVFVGQWRNEIQLRSVGIHSAQREGPLDYALSSLRVYGQSPYLVGIVYDSPRTDSYSLDSLVASALGPIPIIGEPFRYRTGARIYNDAIYGGESNDQILPIWAESERSLGFPGMLLVGSAIGIIMRRINDKMSSAGGAPSLYAWTLGSLWFGQVSIVSIAILAQIAIYFMLPLALLIRLRSFNGPDSARAQRTSTYRTVVLPGSRPRGLPRS